MGKKLSTLLITIVSAIIIIAPISVHASTVGVVNTSTIGVSYSSHVQNIGWQNPVSDGAESGTDGKSLRLEAIKINLTGALPAGAGITYQTQVQNIGWQNWVSNGAEAGTNGRSLREEAIRINLVNLPGYSVQYRVHVQNIGWQGWVSDGALAGTVGRSLRLEALEIKIVPPEGYVYNPELQIDLNVRSAPNLTGTIQGHLYNYDKIKILDTIVDTNDNVVWDKIMYNNNVAYVSNSYIQRYTSPPDDVVTIASNITRQFETTPPNQIAGKADGQGLSLGYLQWCIGQGTLQPILNRMDREYNPEMKNIFGTNYNTIHNMILDTSTNQLAWANSINNAANNIIEPWNSEFISLCNNQDFINIEADAEVYTVNQAMTICDKYNLKTVRGFALAFDIATQNGSISTDATKAIDTALVNTPNMPEKSLLGVIANSEANSLPSISKDVLSREIAIVNGQGTVHGSFFNLDTNYGLNDTSWR